MMTMTANANSLLRRSLRRRQLLVSTSFPAAATSSPTASLLCGRRRCYGFTTTTSLSTVAATASVEIISDEEMLRKEQKGSWALLAALEKAKEAELIEVARLVSSLEALLPRKPQQQDGENQKEDRREETTLLNTFSKPTFRLPVTKVVTGSDVINLLRATRRGHLIDVETVRSLIEGATILNKSRRCPDRLVTIPPLQQNQALQVVGDLHGSLSDLATVLALMPDGEPTLKNRILFNGDLADRGDNGVEVICVVCCLSLAYPEYVYVNRGNHEDIALSIAYGLANEITKKYGSDTRRFLRPTLDAYFRSLPLATVIEDDAIIVHAGPPPPQASSQPRSLKEILLNDHPILTGAGLSRTVVDTSGVPKDDKENNDYDLLGRQIIESMMWSDPCVNTDDCDRHKLREETDDPERKWLPNESRGAGWKFDGSVVRNFLKSEGLTRMIRSHEP